MTTKLSLRDHELANSKIVIKKLKEKLVSTIKFMDIHMSEDKHTNSGYVSHLIHQNEYFGKQIIQLSEENFRLRSMLQLHQDNNSFKSFSDLIAQLEDETTKKDVSPTRDHEVKDKQAASDLVRKTLRDRNKRLGRKRTDSFHFSSMGESSSDEDSHKSLFKLQRKTTSNEFSGYKMQLQPETTEEPKVEETKNDENTQEIKEETKEEQKGTDQATVQPKLNINKGRRRIMSSDNTSDFQAFSPPNDSKRRERSNNQTEDSFGLMKGGGYKMSMKQTEAEETKSPSEDSDYFGSFNKAKSTKTRAKRIKSMMSGEVDEPSQELAENKIKIAPKIKYSIHSIIEEEKSRSSSSTSSVKSSDDLTFLSSSRRSHKKSSFCNSSNKWTNPSRTPSSSSLSTKKLRSFKTKKYTEGDINPLYEFGEVIKIQRRSKRLNSMSMSLNPLE